MAWSDAGQRPEAMPVACTGCDFAVSNRPAVSTPATATYRCRSQSITASGMIYDHVSINLGQEGILVLGAMCGYGIAFLTGSPWLGVLVAGCAGAILGSLHAAICSLPRVND